MTTTRSYYRCQRIAQDIRKEIANLLLHTIRNPSIGLTTISAVEVSRDLSHAKIFVTFMAHQPEHSIQRSLKGLQQSAGFIRKNLSKALCLRIVPELRFVYDQSLDTGRRISEILGQITHPTKDLTN